MITHILKFRQKVPSLSNFRKCFWSFTESTEVEEPLLKSLFAAASQHFVRSVGKRTLLPVDSIDDRDNIRPYQLVVKATKRKFIFFEKTVYYPTEFQLTDILTDTSPLRTELPPFTLISEYNRKAKLSLKGKVGVDITKSVLAVELATNDMVEVNIEFDKVIKHEAHEPQLLRELSSRYVDLDHPYVRQIRQDSTKVLCVISGVASLETGGTIQREMEVGGSSTLKASLIKEAEASGGTTYTRNKDLGLSPGMPLAYSIHQLMVDTHTGALGLALAVGCVGGFVEGLGPRSDAVSGSSAQVKGQTPQQQVSLDIDIRQPRKVFQPLLELGTDQRAKLTADLLYLMSVPRDLTLLDKLFEEVGTGSVSIVTVADLEKKLLSPSSRWLSLLELAGFISKDGMLDSPSAENMFFQCIGEFLDAVTTLDDDEVAVLRLCSANNARLLCRVILDGMQGKQVSDNSVSETLLRDEVTSQILNGLDFKLTESNITPPTSLPFSIDETLWVLYALWGQD